MTDTDELKEGKITIKDDDTRSLTYMGDITHTQKKYTQLLGPKTSVSGVLLKPFENKISTETAKKLIPILGYKICRFCPNRGVSDIVHRGDTCVENPILQKCNQKQRWSQ